MPKLEDFKVGEIKKMISKYNKQVKITTSGLKKADLIKKIREHPRLTVTESEKGVRISVKSDTTMGGKKIKVKKDEKPPPPPPPKPKAQLGQSGIGKKRKREEGKPKKKKVIDVEVKENKEKPKPKPKPKIPTITVTEEEKPKKKVIKRGGRFITVKPKEVKADLPPIPKPKAKIRIAPKKNKQSSKSKDDKTKDKKAGPAEEELEDLSKFKKSKPVFKEDTVEDLMKHIKYHKKQGNDAIVKSLEKELKELKGKGKAKPEPESEEDEPDEIPYKDFKLIEGVPKNIKKIWYDYVDDRTGYANKANQDDELEELQRIEKNYIEAEATRKNKSLSAKKQLKAVRTIGSILTETRDDINSNPDLKKIYKLFTPTILKRVLDQKTKDEKDLKKEQEDIKKQEKADEKEYKKSLKEDKQSGKAKK